MTANATQLTYRYERWRAVTAGILESAATTFLLVIAVRWLHAGATAKALVAGAGSFGLLVSPLVVTWVEKAGWPVTRAAARLSALGAACFLVTALFPQLPVFVIGSVLALAASSSVIPLMTQVYQENYPESARGRLFSHAMMIRIAVAAGFAKLAGEGLDRWPAGYRALLVVFALAFALAGSCFARIPSRALKVAGGSHPFKAMRFVREDRLFRWTLIAWMLMGFANLMLLPLRVEYLANPKYGLQLNVTQVALMVSVIPNLARLVMSPVWGRLFDRMNFFTLRLTLNIGFALGFLSFFTSQSTPGLYLGAIIFGVSNAGGDVAWSLWVTKFAPPDRVADYMSVHTFFTGVRGVLAPVAAFHLAAIYTLPALSWLGIGLIGLSCLMLVPEIGLGRNARRGAALTEEVSD